VAGRVQRSAGFAPIKSLVEQSITIDNAEGMQLVQVGGNPVGSSLDNLCRSWNDSLDNFVYTATDPDYTTADLAELLAASISGSPRVQVYLAGPPDWLDELFHAVDSKGLDSSDWQHWAVD